MAGKAGVGHARSEPRTFGFLGFTHYWVERQVEQVLVTGDQILRRYGDGEIEIGLIVGITRQGKRMRDGVESAGDLRDPIEKFRDKIISDRRNPGPDSRMAARPRA